ncbi:MAG: PilZ domain-containing protein [Polyangia bacterium]
MWKVDSTLVQTDIERATRTSIATPDRRGPARERLDGVADVTYAATGGSVRGATVDLSEDGLSLVCDCKPELGTLLRIDIDGLVIEGRVRHVAKEGVLYKIGVETA